MFFRAYLEDRKYAADDSAAQLEVYRGDTLAALARMRDWAQKQPGDPEVRAALLIS